MITRTLVLYATKMGSTREIAEAIGEEIARSGIEVTVRPVTEAGDLEPYGTVVLGSAIYMTRWRRPAVRFLRQHVAELRERRVWLFHSGPLGEKKGEPQRPPGNVRRLAARIGTAPPITFAGSLSPERVQGSMARKMALSALAGDYRSWEDIRAWAATIARQIPTATG